MSQWHSVMSVEELPAQGFRAMEINGTPILVGRVHQQIFACLDRCPHAGAPLRIGKLRGEELQCSRHGWIFNVVTGQCVPDDPSCRLGTLATKIEGSRVHVEL